MTGIDVSGRVILLDELQADLEQGGVPVPHGLSLAGLSSTPVWPLPPLGALPPPLPAGSKLFTYDAQGAIADLPPEAEPIVAAYTPGTG